LNFADVKRLNSRVKIRDDQKLETDDILICAGSGSKDHIGKVAYIWQSRAETFGGFMGVVRTLPMVIPRFMFHLLTGSSFKRHLESAMSSTTINNLNSAVLSGWKIPIPPLEVQREIVRILDQFTKLEAELEAELEVRRRQYDHVRQELLTLSQGSGARFEKIGDLCTLVRGVELSLDDRKVGDYPLVTAGKTELARHNAFNYEKPSVTVTSHGAYAGFVNYWSNPIWLGNNVFLLEPKERVEVKFLFYSMKNQERLIQSRAKGGGVPYLNWKDIESIEIAVPRIETQRQIVKALDHFTELQRELESELISRRNQHRFYLDKLFEFPEATTP
jgi:type I restriction enzyme S subunit